jgi:hypothetical protein
VISTGLIMKKALSSNPGTQFLRAANCLLFLSCNFEHLVDSIKTLRYHAMINYQL